MDSFTSKTQTDEDLPHEEREKHMQDPFHDVVTCQLCNPKNSDHSKICQACATYVDEESRYKSNYRCWVCWKSFTFCARYYGCYRRILQSCHLTDSHNNTMGVCNWCAINMPSIIQSPYPCTAARCGLCSGSFRNKHYQSVTKGAITHS